MTKSLQDTTETQKNDPTDVSFTVQAPSPGLLIAHAPPDAVSTDRCILPRRLVCGRSADCDLPVFDSRISGRHFCIRTQDGDRFLDDLGSTNGTFVNGAPLLSPFKLTDTAVIRCGETVLVYRPDIAPQLRPASAERRGFAGRFHAGPLLFALKEASLSAHHILIAGPSGTGKELAARALAHLTTPQGTNPRFWVYNAAKFASREEAAATLFGVSARVFSNVDARAGFIEQADGGTLFLDELHNLPTESQRALLRVIEDGEVTRLGETKGRRVHVRFVIASNAPGDTHGLAPDLFARLRLVRLPSLNERIADVPSIFTALLGEALSRRNIPPETVVPLLSGDHFESLCLENYEQGNVRLLRDLADRLVTRLTMEHEPLRAVADVFGERFQGGPVVRRTLGSQKEAPTSRYLRHKTLIIDTFRACNANTAATERALKEKGFSCSRRWLSIFLEDWGEKNR